MRGYYRTSLTGSTCGLLADLLPVTNAATLVRKSDGVLAGYPERDDHKVFGLGRAHPYGKGCCGIVEVLCITYCHSGGDDPRMLQVSFSWTSRLPLSCHCSGDILVRMSGV